MQSGEPNSSPILSPILSPDKNCDDFFFVCVCVCVVVVCDHPSCACLGIEFKILESFQVEPTAQSQCTAKDLKKSFIFHYTYPLEYRENGNPMPPNEVGFWSLNKRNYGSNYPPKDLTPPPEGAHAGAAFITKAWTEAIGNQSEAIWKQSTVTLGTIGWMPKVSPLR